MSWSTDWKGFFIHMERMHEIQLGVMASFGLFQYFEDQKKRSNSSPRRTLNLKLQIRDSKQSRRHNKKCGPQNLSNERKKEKKDKSDGYILDTCDLTEESHIKKQKFNNSKDDDPTIRLFGNVSPRKKLRDANGHPSEVEKLEWTSEKKNVRNDDCELAIKRKLQDYNPFSKASVMDKKMNKLSNPSNMGVSQTLSLIRKSITETANDTGSHDKPSNPKNTSLNLLKQYGDQEEDNDKVIKTESVKSKNWHPLRSFKSPSKHKDDSDDDELEIVSHEQETFKFSPTDLNWQCIMCNKFGLVVLKEIHPEQSDVPLAPPAHIRQTSSDGNCFFRCLSYALTGREKEHARIRNLVTDYMKQIEPQLEKHLGHNMTVDKYLRETEMSELSVWSTDVEIFVSSALLNTDIYVYSYYSHKKWKWVKFPAKHLQPTGGEVLNKKAIYLKNTCQLHYDVVTSVKVVIDQN